MSPPVPSTGARVLSAAQEDPRDFSSRYNTPIPASKKKAFQEWLKRQSEKQKRDILKDMYDYDIQGFFLSGADHDPRGHGPDTFKKPNHPTFSIESQYSTDGSPGGRWVDLGNGKSAFVASPQNLRYRSPDELKGYFKQIEPDSMLYLPPNAPGPAAPPKAKVQPVGMEKMFGL